MKKKYNKGFILMETLVVATFVSSVLIFLFIEFSNLNKSYEESFKYNTINDLYSLEDVINYINSDDQFLNYIDNNIAHTQFIDITDCSLFFDSVYCTNLLEAANIKKIFVTTNKINKNNIPTLDAYFNEFINLINEEGTQKYRIIVSFRHNTYATLRFGD